MIIKEWKYTNDFYHSVDYDKFYCPIIRRWVNLGWDEYDNMVHSWVSALNCVSSEIYKNIGIGPREIRINSKTFELLRIICNDYYNYKDGKLNHYKVTVSEEVENNKINVLVDGDVKGQIIITK